MFSEEERPPILNLAEVGLEHTLRVPEAISRLMAKIEVTPDARVAAAPSRPLSLPDVSVEGPPIHVRYDAMDEVRPPRERHDATVNTRMEQMSRTDPDAGVLDRALERDRGSSTRPEGVRARVASEPQTRDVSFKDLREEGRAEKDRDEERKRANQEERERGGLQESWDRRALRLRDTDPERSALIANLQEALRKRNDLQTHEGAMQALVEHDELARQTQSANLLRTAEDAALALSQIVAERRESEDTAFRAARNEILGEVQSLSPQEKERIHQAVSSLAPEEANDRRFLQREMEAHVGATTDAERFALYVAAVAHAAPSPVRLVGDFSFAEDGTPERAARVMRVEEEAARLATDKSADRLRAAAEAELARLRVSVILTPDRALSERAEELATALHRAAELRRLTDSDPTKPSRKLLEEDTTR